MNKKSFLTAVLHYSGVLWLMEKFPAQPYVLILNFHRLGNRDKTEFDKNVFSATEETFEERVKYFSKKYQVLTRQQILDLPETLRTITRNAIIITFDDGYKDNYTIGVPVLKKYNFPGVFFIPTYILQNPTLPWWDAVYLLVNRSARSSITIDLDGEKTFDLTGSKDASIKAILRAIKRAKNLDYKLFVRNLAAACGVEFEEGADLARDLFVNGDILAKMTQDGMLIGSHTHSHYILNHLSADQQKEELEKSRQNLERVLGHDITLLAYPVGGRSAFSETTRKIARQVGYKLGFSFYGAIVRKNHSDWFDVPRITSDYDDSLAKTRLRIQVARWFNKRF